MPVKPREVRLSLDFMNNNVTKYKKTFDSVANLADKHGLLFFGVSGLNVAQDFVWYEQWLDEGRHAGMDYLARNLAVRANPELLLEGAKTAWIFGLPYYLGDTWRRGDVHVPARFAMYSRIKDYHKVLRASLDNLFTEILQTSYPQDEAKPNYRVTVDSAPLLERALAANTASVFIGKNTCVIHPKKGSFFLLGEVLTSWNPGVETHDVQTTRHRERTSEGGCGTCRRCQVHCPTGALDRDYQIDARKCLSWWTIENRGAIPKEFWPWIGRYMYGCDICQLVCPWNRGVPQSEVALSLLKLEKDLDLFVVATMDQGTYECTFGGTPATRAKREGLMRNALIAMHVKNDDRLNLALEKASLDPSTMIQETIAMIREELVSP